MSGCADFLTRRDYAHRGLHGGTGGLIENSLPAFTAALTGGFGMECDVRLSVDGIVYVFHDETLERLTDKSGAFAGLSAQQLDAIPLRGNGGAIPTLRVLLETVGGRQPLLIEIKIDGVEPVGPLCAAVERDLRGYDGPVAIMSFDPRVGRWFASHAPHIVRGLVVTEEEGNGVWQTLKRRLAFAHAWPDFLAYDIRDLPTSRLAARARARGLPVLSWTVRTTEQWEAVRRCGDGAIFEGAVQPRHG